jgi:hypothetical protein
VKVDINEKIAKRLYVMTGNAEYYWDKSDQREYYLGQSDAIMSESIGLTPAEIAELNNGGHLCVMAKDQTLPKCPYKDNNPAKWSDNSVDHEPAYKNAQIDMIEANFVRVIERK